MPEVKELADKFREIEVEIVLDCDEFGAPIEILGPNSAQALARVAEKHFEEREAYKQTVDWGRGLANQVLEMVNLHYLEKEEKFRLFAVLPPMSQLLSYYAATLNEWIGKLIGEEPK